MKQSILGRIARREIPSHIFYEDEEYMAILDINPLVPGHTLLIPKRYATTLYDLDDAQMKSLGAALRNVSYILAHEFGCNLSLANSNGEAASQSVPYLHFHLMPRDPDDRLWQEGRSLIPYDRSSGFKRMQPESEILDTLVVRLRTHSHSLGEFLSKQCQVDANSQHHWDNNDDL